MSSTRAMSAMDSPSLYAWRIARSRSARSRSASRPRSASRRLYSSAKALRRARASGAWRLGRTMQRMVCRIPASRLASSAAEPSRLRRAVTAFGFGQSFSLSRLTASSEACARFCEIRAPETPNSFAASDWAGWSASSWRRRKAPKPAAFSTSERRVRASAVVIGA